MTQEKDKIGQGRDPKKTLLGVAQVPSSRVPRPSERGSSRPPAMPSRPPAPPAPQGRDFFAALTSPQSRAPKAPQANPGPARPKEGSLEEISNSLLLEDESSAVMPGLEELSGSLLLDEPTEVRPDLAASSPQARMFSQTQPGAGPVVHPSPSAQVAPPEPSPRAPLPMPELPPATPPPNLATLPPMPTSSRPRVNEPALGVGDTEGPLDADAPTRIMPPVQGDPPGVPPPPQHMYETLRGYEEQPVGPAAPPPSTRQVPGGEPAYPSTSPVHGDVEVHSLPVSRWTALVEGVRSFLSKARALAGEAPPLVTIPPNKKPIFLGAIALAGLLVGIGIVALIVSLTRKGPDDTAAADEANAKKALAPAAAAMPAPSETAMATPVEPAPAPAPEPAPRAPAASTAACVVGGAPRTVAPSAIVAAGVEVRTVGDDVALGFAPNDHQATALRLDASSLASTSKVDSQSSDAVRRVVPLASADGALTIAEDTDREGDALQGRRTIALDPPLEIGAAGGNVVWGRPGAGSSGKLWPLDGDGPVEALRGATDTTQDAPVTAIAFRHAGSIWLGTAVGRDALAPLGALTRAAGTSAGVGSPAIAANGGVVMAAWADRAAATDPWRLRWLTFKAGEAPGEPGTFTPPAGGRGEQAMSPGIAAVPGGRFLLVWTEGPAAHHDVRALTLSHDGQPLGKPLVISAKHVNAGQGNAAFNSAGRGAVAFLESAESPEPNAFRVVATPIRCP
ncbi:MAG TPA: hypothetical protein VHV30_13200 [Polyangiaceae bacterium]|nr:hypothetical protein [Polyangiaceae bacterium]